MLFTRRKQNEDDEKVGIVAQRCCFIFSKTVLNEQLIEARNFRGRIVDVFQNLNKFNHVVDFFKIEFSTQIFFCILSIFNLHINLHRWVTWFTNSSLSNCSQAR